MSDRSIRIATQMGNIYWAVGRGVPNIVTAEDVLDGKTVAVIRVDGLIPGTKITRIVLVGDQVEVFGEDDANPGRPFRWTLAKASMKVISSKYETEAGWQAALAEFDEDPEVLEQVSDLEGNVWKVGGLVPDSGVPLVIERMALDEDASVEVFARPRDVQAKAARLHFRLMPLYTHTAKSTFTPAAWLEAQQELADVDEVASAGAEADAVAEDLEEVTSNLDVLMQLLVEKNVLGEQELQNRLEAAAAEADGDDDEADDEVDGQVNAAIAAGGGPLDVPHAGLNGTNPPAPPPPAGPEATS